MQENISRISDPQLSHRCRASYMFKGPANINIWEVAGFKLQNNRFHDALRVLMGLMGALLCPVRSCCCSKLCFQFFVGPCGFNAYASAISSSRVSYLIGCLPVFEIPCDCVNTFVRSRGAYS